MKTRLGILLGMIFLFTGCVAIPPLITVQRHDNGGDEEHLRKRIDELEQRVRELESGKVQP